jgi:hypothetical protein
VGDDLDGARWVAQVEDVGNVCSRFGIVENVAIAPVVCPYVVVRVVAEVNQVLHDAVKATVGCVGDRIGRLRL